ncbi:MerR family transcriptional regulator [Streptomyces exfoliatus]|uniref:MerR family transcriptional regulator n=1 Tax=Streptomyces exfoliatus TaxID=1905 RepID=UPI0018E347FB|nr:MerR family transcriptional regulator [Streptomyces exfoliatus]
MTIGEFARASRLSAKALRRYDELGLLTPDRVDAHSGYRYYAGAQVERARLVAWLRRIGMPLAEVRDVCALHGTDPGAAARTVRAYWARVEAETAARRDLAASLVDRLGGPTDMTAMTSTTNARPYGLLSAALSERGRVRASNQDRAYAGPCLLAVADGYGEAGERAATAALAEIEGVRAPDRAGDLLNALEDGVRRADTAVGAAAPGSGTTLTAGVWTGDRLALAHVGDGRAYLLRDGELTRLTRDHTVVQARVEAGELDAAEAAAHPDRVLLLRALDGAGGSPVPDLGLYEGRPGDRWLLCTDGLSAVVPEAELHGVLAAGGSPEDTVRALADLALADAEGRGGPDNVSCVVADVVP